MPKKLKNNSGQALLIVLLSVAVVLTIILSILARSIVDISVTSQGEDSLKAFSAAEAGVEKAFIGAISGTSEATTEVGSKYITSVSSFAEGESAFVSPITLVSGESSTVWFVSHDENGNFSCNGKPCFTGNTIKVCWGKQGTEAGIETTPAIELSFFYLTVPFNYSTAQIGRVVLDPNSSRIAENHFSSPDGGECIIDGQTFPFQKTITLSSLGVSRASAGNLLFAKMKFFYNTDTAQPYGIDANGSILPSQGTKVDSSGSSGNANRKLDVFQSFGETPEIFDSVLFSMGGITKEYHNPPTAPTPTPVPTEAPTPIPEETPTEEPTAPVVEEPSSEIPQEE